MKPYWYLLSRSENWAWPVWACYLWYSVRCWVHELGEVHHTLPLILGDVDALNWGKAGVGVPEVLQLELPLRQPGPGQLHKHLPGQNGAVWLHLAKHINWVIGMLPNADVTLCLRRTMSWERRMRPHSFAGWRGKMMRKTKVKCIRLCFDHNS